jgi:predicted short-subunit dehydrogenase-like oxidoreductase (DUF2520 family)
VSKQFALIGPGRVGSAISRALFEKGYQPVAVIGRSLQSAQEACSFIGCDKDLATMDLRAAGRAELILLAVPDDRIAAVASQLQLITNPEPETTVLIHFSGVHAAAIMRPAKGGMLLFSVHPLLPFADRQQAFERLSLAPYIGEGDEAARPLAAALCEALGGRLENIPTAKKPLYHAATCLASNYFVTLIAEATTLLRRCDIGHSRVEHLLLPLLQSTLDNVALCGTRQGLTGPIVRGDIGTLSAHLRALQQQPELLDLYCRLGCRTALLAEDSGRLKSVTAKTIIGLLEQNSTCCEGK